MENLPNYDLWKLSEPDGNFWLGSCYDCADDFDEGQQTYKIFDSDTKKEELICEDCLKIRQDEALIEVCQDVSDSLDDLYKHEPEIAGTHFGAALSERMKNAIKTTKGGI